MNEERYLIPKGLRSQIMFGIFSLADIVVLLGTLALWFFVIKTLNLGVAINIILLIVYGFIGLFLVMRTSDNPDRTRLSTILQALLKQDKKQYKSLDYNAFVIENKKDVK